MPSYIPTFQGATAAWTLAKICATSSNHAAPGQFLQHLAKWPAQQRVLFERIYRYSQPNYYLHKPCMKRCCLMKFLCHHTCSFNTHTHRAIDSATLHCNAWVFPIAFEMFAFSYGGHGGQFPSNQLGGSGASISWFRKNDIVVHCGCTGCIQFWYSILGGFLNKNLKFQSKHSVFFAFASTCLTNKDRTSKHWL